MFNLHTFLEKFKNLKDPKEDKTILSTIIFEVARVKVLESEMSVQKGTVFIQSSPLYKNRIFLMKGEIIKRVNLEAPELGVIDIV